MPKYQFDTAIKCIDFHRFLLSINKNHLIATDFDGLTTPGLFEFNYTEFFTSHGGYICCKCHILSSWYWILSRRSRWWMGNSAFINSNFFCLLLS